MQFFFHSMKIFIFCKFIYNFLKIVFFNVCPHQLSFDFLNLYNFYFYRNSQFFLKVLLMQQYLFLSFQNSVSLNQFPLSSHNQFLIDSKFFFIFYFALLIFDHLFLILEIQAGIYHCYFDHLIHLDILNLSFLFSLDFFKCFNF